MEKSCSVRVTKYYEKCTLKEATSLLDLFSRAGCCRLFVKVCPETNEYDEPLGTYAVIVESCGYGGAEDLDGVLELVEHAFKDISFIEGKENRHA